MKYLYLIFAILGLVLPYSQLIPFLMENGLNISLFISQLFANRISGFFGWDVIISAVVLIPFIIVESKKLKITNYWIAIVGTCLVGVSFGLPLFLFLREIHQEK